MDSSPVDSPPSIRVYDFNHHHDRPRPTSRSSNSVPIHGPSPAPMSIPNSRGPIAPPPLPPPRFIEDLTPGNDPGWQWANTTHGGHTRSTLAPIKPGSSLMGNYRRESWEEKHEPKPSFRRGSSISTLVGPPAPAEDVGHTGEEDYLSPASYQFQGENELSQKILGPSSNAYDKHLLSKIGKPNSPSRTSCFGGSISTLPFHSKEGAKSSLSPPDASNFKSALSMPDGAGDPSSRWTGSAPSSGVSPSARPYWGKDYMDYRSSSVDSSVPSPAVDLDHYPSAHTGGRRSASGSVTTNFDESSSLPSRSNRGSYDQASFMDPDVDFPIDDSGMGKLYLDDAAASQAGGHSPMSKQGMKRRASSPRQNSRDVKQQVHMAAGDAYQPRVSGQPFANRGHIQGSFSSISSASRGHPMGSLSSTSSGSLRTSSLASSAVLSSGSSMTSISSFDRYSPGGVSPKSDVDAPQDSPYVTPVSLDPSPRGSFSNSNPPAVGIARKAASQSTAKKASANKGTLVCQCCPKKPQKFDNVDDLREHEMDKQYTCQFCQRRFKNKNEAERHQNSLHIRRHSWSCAALAVRFQDAFHPSTSQHAQTPNGVASDACGYCGEEFQNFPRPDWDRRLDHLNNVHKYGECNQAKKFFRADHFRQHLKHSHAGTPGKWTNMLENACMKDEPPPASMDQRGGAPNGMALGIGGVPAVGPTIDEVHDET